jgi:hypothetical protein
VKWLATRLQRSNARDPDAFWIFLCYALWIAAFLITKVALVGANRNRPGST